MLKNLILASATAVVALAAITEFTETAEARSAAPLAQSLQLKQPGADPQPDPRPGRRPSSSLPSGPQHQGPANLAPKPFVDLYGLPYYPATYEGLPGHYYCSFLAGNDKVSKAVQVKVRNQGTKVAGNVQVVFEFNGGKTVKQTLPMNNLNASYIFEANIPASAWQNNSASFTIRIDHPNKVAESNEGNNVINSFCMGPEG
jgi:hypothetical protein